jgi:hypothetical protein
MESFKQTPVPALPSPPQPQLVDPLSWLPAGLLTGAAPRVPITSNTTGQAIIFVQLLYFGHTLYYQPRQRLLLWRAAPGELRLLAGPEQVAAMAEQIPCEPAGWDAGPGSGNANPRLTG